MDDVAAGQLFNEESSDKALPTHRLARDRNAWRCPHERIAKDDRQAVESRVPRGRRLLAVDERACAHKRADVRERRRMDAGQGSDDLTMSDERAGQRRTA